MQIKILCVGKLKESYFIQAIEEFQKRLSRFVTLEIREIPDEKAPDSLSPAQEQQVMEKEGKRILEKIGPGEHVIPLCIGGKQYDSLAFSSHLQDLMDSGKSRITFVIGGSLGLSPQVIARGNETLSLSRMTLPHRIARLVLLEQLFRAFKIQNNETYHK